MANTSDINPTSKRPVRSSLAFVFMPQFKWRLPVITQTGKLLRPLLLIPLVVSGLLPQKSLIDENSLFSHLRMATTVLFGDINKRNWNSVYRKAPALLAVLGLILFAVASIITFVSGLILSPAHAQDVGSLFDTPGRSETMIADVFGASTTGPAGAIFQGALGKMLFIYNTGMFVFAMIIMIYQAAYLVVATAEDKDGEAGGKKSNLTWFLIRSVIAVALIFPLPVLGFSGGQMLVISLANAGSSLATKVWSEFAEATLVTGNPISTPRPPAEIDQLVGKLLIVEACTISANIMAARAGDDPYIEVVQTYVDHQVTNNNITHTTNRQTLINYDGRTGALDQRACGQVRFPVLNKEGNEINAPIITAHKQAFLTTRPAIIRLARELTAHFIPGTPEFGTPLPNPGKLLKDRGIVSTWHSNILSAIESAKSQTQANINQQTVDQISEEGWVSAGAWFHKIATVNGEFISTVAALPSVSLPLGAVERKVPVTGNVLGALSIWWDDYSSESSTSSSLRRTTSTLADAGSPDLWDILVEYFKINEVVLSLVEAEGSNPLADLAATGHAIMWIALTGFGALAGASLIPLVNGTIFNFVGIALLALLVPGATLAIWLPLLPFVRFVFGVLSWLVNLLAAVVFCPLLLLAHLGTSGSGVYTQTTAAGYNLLLQLILRPVLMVIGLISGMLIFNTVIRFFNDFFYPTIIAANNGSSSGLVVTIFYVIFYCVTAYGLANSAFKTIDVLPEKVLDWMGGRGAVGVGGTSATERKAHGGSGKLESVAGGAKGMDFKKPGP
ncbi:DotA/TraY family protein [Kiloniella sp.]|uniref:DotA/TraY family protein n=1 Tax=Kiloniella sp. TaxID=1938587 RepID=UPI003B018B5C